MVYQIKNHKRNIFEELKRLIMQGVYKPRERLLERPLAARFGVSRTPVREALRKLESLGMVNIIQHQGAQVSDFSFQDIEDLYLVRINLEKLAGKIAISTVNLKEVEALSAINQKLHKALLSKDFHKMVEFDQLFHRELIGISKNQFLIKAIEEIRLKSYPISYYVWRNAKNIKKSVLEHREIINALRMKDEKKLEKMIQMQLSNAKIFYLKALSMS